MAQVVITGIGAVSPGGWTLASTWKAARLGRSLTTTLSRFDTSRAPTRVAATVPGSFDFLPDNSLAVTFGKHAAEEALCQAATAGGSASPTMAVVASHGERRMPTKSTGALICSTEEIGQTIARSFGIDRVVTGHGACASGTISLGVAARYVSSGRAECVLVGAADSLLNDYDFFQFCNLHGMTERECDPHEASCPFDARRDGFVMSEGAAFFVLESAAHARNRGASVLAEVRGFGYSQSAFHYVALQPNAAGPSTAMRRALDDAGLGPDDIQYINAHGTSTPDNDRCETRAVRNVFGRSAERVLMSSTKSTLGHATAAAGAVEAAICVMALQDQLAPPTANLHSPGDGCDLDYVPLVARQAQLDNVMSNSFGFGGHNGTLIFGRAA